MSLSSLVLPAIAAVALALGGGQLWAWSGAKRLGLTGEEAAKYRASARTLSWIIAPASFAGFWVSLNGASLGLSELQVGLAFFALWLGGANLLILFSSRLPVVGRLAEPAASDMRNQYYGGLFNK